MSPVRYASYAASLATNPASGGSPAIDAAASTAAPVVHGSRRPSPESRRRSRVPGRMIDDADDEEERGLEQRVREQHRRAGQRGDAGARADQDDKETELAHGAEGEQQLAVA